ncbi:Rrf2 family transcriptional regulator [Candidatus Berkiella aquae]|uniref:HTH-type transcriptional regulator IscR n=1 Tax=Candidatus Berkiella aquae TaxID=295108 RepID=A0A0Q9YKT2_9GAMM|nr:Rrf2 family transcriptional regulator [Candidatus Berkiella aquae]MCS5711028.1 Rrf2 family transcriptional regulator [Candidatus Berkiella aquae]
MKLTTKGRYAVTALVDLASRHQSEPISIAEVALRHRISVAYLERLAGVMRAKGLLKSVRGPKGGYVLAKPPAQITVADIIQAVDEKIDTTRCHGKGNCHEGTMCITHHLWDRLNQEIFDFLKSITLSELINEPHLLAQKNNTYPLQWLGANHA